ncbi:DNA repair protein RecN [Croceiramulus getboli]|nr:DNA repair protein RecN [Flavobacteriaceae bacterium YJPT1-3]
MLETLTIKNYALIDKAHLSFEQGFTVITGETGAGKSILLGALGLILGNRADLSSIGSADQKCVIEATFNLKQWSLQGLFEAEDLDYEERTIVRREILPSGKSRAFVNDTPVNLSQLNALGAQLVDIHSQHETRTIMENEYQFQVVDAFAKNKSLLHSYQVRYGTLRNQQHELKSLQQRQQEAQKEADYNGFLLQELLDAQLKPGEEEEIEQEFNTLNNSEQITEALSEAYQLLQQPDNGVNELLQQINVKLARLSTFSPTLEDLHNRINSVSIELDDITETLDDYTQTVDADPSRLAFLDTRLRLIHDLKKKHQVATVEELIDLRESLDNAMLEAGGLEDRIEKLEQEIAFAKAELEQQADELHKNRTAALPQLAKTLEAMLDELGMPNARFNLKVIKTEALNSRGMDQLEFLFSANKGMPPQELKKAASGGELSRIMLTLKAALSEFVQLPTLIFDEIDTGVSGEIALKMGGIMKQMGAHMQLISITHLPQIAGQGEHHMKVYKEDGEQRTLTYIEPLQAEDRVVEIAQMLGGKSNSETALSHARQLLN